MPDTNALYDRLCEYVRKTALLTSTSALLEWDQQTKLPAAAGEYRSAQLTFLAGEIHRRSTAAELGDMIGELSRSDLAADPMSITGCVIARLEKKFHRTSKLPVRLVEELTRACSSGQRVWVEARQEDDFAKFRPVLETIIELKKEQAGAIGFEDCAYDALLDEFEPGAKTNEVADVLERLRVDLVPLVEAIKASAIKPPVEILHRSFPVADQEAFGRYASEKIGFDYDRGRLDVTHHPFCTEIGPDDCRITTRYDETFFSSSFFGTLHEAGHGIYEQGLDSTHYGLPAGQYCSLGIHESQSRLWENLVGRSKSFWKHFYPEARQRFASLANVPLEDFYAAINHVAPSLIRVEADEATYNLHIIIRFQLEQALINGELAVADLPEAWNAKYQDSLGILPPSDSDGVLQDVHWSAGLIGYFPTYSLGNLYASQFYDAAEARLGNLEAMFAKGDFAPLKQWLNQHIHAQGQRLTSTQLGEKVAGEPLSHDRLIKHLKEKLTPIYQL